MTFILNNNNQLVSAC